MNLHQVLTGAVNPGDNCFSVGSVNNVPFTAYASGCDVVILGSDFERLQIIPGAKHGNIQVGCVDCSSQGGQYQWNPKYQREDDCSHVTGDCGEESVAIHQDDEDKTLVEDNKGDFHLVSEEEDKSV